MSAQVIEYQNFEELQRKEPAVNYSITVEDRNSPVAIIAPHGGDLEKPSSELVVAIAGAEFSYYSFNSKKRKLLNLLRKDPNFRGHTLHIKSERFDEPKAVALVEKSDIVVAIHGRDNHGDRDNVWVGGRDVQLGTKVCFELNAEGFSVKRGRELGNLQGLNILNICNRGRSGQGVQIELSAAMRKELWNDRDYFGRFVLAIRKAIVREAHRRHLIPAPIASAPTLEAS